MLLLYKVELVRNKMHPCSAQFNKLRAFAATALHGLV